MWNFRYPLPYGVQRVRIALWQSLVATPRGRVTPPLPCPTVGLLIASDRWEEQSCRVESRPLSSSDTAVPMLREQSMVRGSRRLIPSVPHMLMS